MSCRKPDPKIPARTAPTLADPLALLAATSGLDALLDALADRIVARLESRSSSPRYCDAQSNPYGSARAFLDAARRGDFDTFLRVRKTTALVVDVEAAIERRRRVKPSAAAPTQADDDRAELEQMGVKLRPVNDTAKRARAAAGAR